MRRVISESERLMSSLPLPSDGYRAPTAELDALRGLEESCLTRQEVDVLAAVLEAETEESYGYELSRTCSAPTGSMYRVLGRLEHAGLVRSRPEAADVADAEGRPQRRLYSLTSKGESELARWRAVELRRSPSARLFYLIDSRYR